MNINAREHEDITDRQKARAAYIAARAQSPHWADLKACEPGSPEECDAWAVHEQWRDSNPLWLAWCEASRNERVASL